MIALLYPGIGCPTSADTCRRGPEAGDELPDGCWVKAVMRNDADVTDRPIDVNHGDALGGFTIVLDNAPTKGPDPC